MNKELALRNPNEGLEKGPKFGRELQFSNGVSVLPVGVKHDGPYWRTFKETFRGIIDTHDFIVTEGDPIILSELPDTEASQSFFIPLLHASWEANKPVVYTDPHTSTHLYIDIAQTVVSTGLLLGGGYGVGKSIAREQGEKMSRRKLIASGLAFGASFPLYASSMTGASQVDAVMRTIGNDRSNLAHNKLAMRDFRDAGAVLGLETAATLGAIQGKGAYVVGNDHVRDLEYYASDLQAAKKDYEMNIRTKIDSVLPVSPVRIWLPDQSQQYSFNLAAELPR
jgi:hypothetical protein